MNSLLKIPYEISLWDDRLTAVDEQGNEYENFIDASEVDVVAQYYKEKKLCVIGSNTMEAPFRAIEPNLVRKTDGTSTLTFSVYAKYYDEESGEFKPNPFIKYLNNERKVKLKYYPNGELRWLDFVIKKIDESSENYKFKYTATDLFINELSKTGYNLEFDTERENNQGTVQELAGRILESSEWSVGDDSEIIQQLNSEPLYKIKLVENLIAYDIFTNQEILIPGGETIYAFYSSNQTPEHFQFIYNKNGKYLVDENDIVYDVGNYYCNQESFHGESLEYHKDFRGEKYVRTQKSEYDKVLERYVQVYEKDGKEYYGYVDTQYLTPSLVFSYITNGQQILNASGWDKESDGTVEIAMYPRVGAKTTSEPYRFGIKHIQNDGNTYLLNSGFRDNAEIIKEISTNQLFAFKVKCRAIEEDEDGNITNIRSLNDQETISMKVVKYPLDDNGAVSEEEEEEEEEEILFEGNAQYHANDEYYALNLEPKRAVAYDELTNATAKSRIGIFLEFSNGKYLIEQVELFPQYYGAPDGGEKEGIILPNGKVAFFENNTVTISEDIAKARIINTYHFYPIPEDGTNGAPTKPEEIEYTYIGEENTSYIPVYDYNFEKVRSISKKESNRFDLLQTLSETFECWCRFDIWHKDTGEILLQKDLKNLVLDGGTASSTEKLIFLGGTAYSKEEYLFFSPQLDLNDMGAEDSVPLTQKDYRQLKFVTFHKRIGQKKNIGFRYGMNLKSITRSLDSGDIATKLIVKSNSNEFAESGSCNIARAKENPSGENFVYDFTHYIRQGLLDQDNLNNDLYYIDNPNNPRGWIGLYARLKPLNRQRDELITQQLALFTQQMRSSSTFETSKMQLISSQEALDDLKDKHYDITGVVYGKDLGEDKESWLKDKDYLALVFDIERLWAKIETLTKEYETAEDEMDDLEDQLESLSTDLQDIENITAELISLFETKYSRFIQEASWTSEDYIDDNLYYLDAETTLHKSAQPKVSYNINIIELSRLEEYKDYNFDLGDISYVQDTDFFGWKQINGLKTPRKEEIVITEMSTFFEEPEKSTIKAQNYRSAFEDLFQRLTASSQQLQFHSGEYARAADVVDTNGNIAPSCLEDAFANNAYVLSNAANQSVKWDETGITTTNTRNPAELVRLTSGGMFLSKDGGQKWTTGITADGINAKVITTGTLNTGLVNIYNGSQKSFVWDAQGINAYDPKGDGVYSTTNYVRFNHDGLVGKEKGIETFSLTESGLRLAKGSIFIDDNNGNSVLIDPLLERSQNEVFQISANNNKIMSIDKNGNATFSGVIHAKEGGSIAGWNINKSSITKGKLGEDASICISSGDMNGVNGFFDGIDIDDWMLTIGSNFGVTADGGVYSQKGKIAGWTINPHKLTAGTLGNDGFIGLYTWFLPGDGNENSGKTDGNDDPVQNDQATVGNHSDTSWRFIIGNNFGVNNKGHLYAVDAELTGYIKAESGFIGNWEIDGNGLKYNSEESRDLYLLINNTWYKYTTTIKNTSITPTGISYSVQVTKELATGLSPATKDFGTEEELCRFYGIATSDINKGYKQKAVSWGNLGSLAK